MQGQNLAQGWRGRDGEEENTLCRAWEEKEKSTRSIQESREGKYRDWVGGTEARGRHLCTLRPSGLILYISQSVLLTASWELRFLENRDTRTSSSEEFL